MKILLIKPYWPYPGRESTYNRIWPPLCLANCAALLEQNGHQVKILDAHAERIKPQDIKKHINGLARRSFSVGGFDKIFITSSTIDRWQCPNLDFTTFWTTTDELRTAKNDFYVMGYHGTVKPEEMLRLTGAKAIIRGEPELTVLDLCRETDFSKIDGITYRSNAGIISNKNREPLNLDILPLPAWHLLNFKKYFHEVLGDNLLLLEASRGCHYQCSFCSKVMYGNRFRRKSPQKIMAEIKEGVFKHGVKTGQFMDLEFTADEKWTGEFCDCLSAISGYDFKWACQTRVDQVSAALLKKMRQAGCHLILYGIETGSPRVMNLIDKNLSLPQIEESINLTKKAGIKTIGIFLLGLPDETEEDRKMTVDFAKKLNPDYVSFHIATPYPGSKLSDGNNDKPSAVPQKPAGLFSVTVNGYNLPHLKKEIRQAYFRFYFNPKYVFKTLCRDSPAVVRQGLRLFFNYLK